MKKKVHLLVNTILGERELNARKYVVFVTQCNLFAKPWLTFRIKAICGWTHFEMGVRTWWNGDGGWSEGVKWKKRALVVDENLSFVECRNLERAESDVVEYFEELR